MLLVVQGQVNMTVTYFKWSTSLVP